MPVLLVTPQEGFKMGRDRCRAISNEIRTLESSPLKPGETIDDRMRSIACLAMEFAEMFDLLDTCAVLRAKREDTNASPPQSSTGSPVTQGCATEEDPTTN